MLYMGVFWNIMSTCSNYVNLTRDFLWKNSKKCKKGVDNRRQVWYISKHTRVRQLFSWDSFEENRKKGLTSRQRCGILQKFAQGLRREEGWAEKVWLERKKFLTKRFGYDNIIRLASRERLRGRRAPCKLNNVKKAYKHQTRTWKSLKTVRFEKAPELDFFEAMISINEMRSI